MTSFRDRSPRSIALVVLLIVAAGLGITLNLSRLPFSSAPLFHADLADAGSLVPGEQVTVHGVKAGTIRGVSLEGNHVRMDFSLDSNLRLGDGTTLAIKVLSPLGQEYAELTPRGGGRMTPGATIPIDRTSISPTFVNTFNQAGGEIGQINQSSLAQALRVADSSVTATPPAVTAAALAGVSDLSTVINQRQSKLSALFDATEEVTAQLKAHQQPLITLIGQANLVLQVLQERNADIHQLLASTQDLSQRVSQVITDPHLATLLSSLQTVSGVLTNQSKNLGDAVPLVAGLSRYLANATGNGPYIDVTAPTFFLDDQILGFCDRPGVTPPVGPTTALNGPGCPSP